MMNNDYLDRIKDVITYIEQHIDQKMDLDRLAGISNFSKYHFSRIFTSLMGKTPMAYVTQKRLERSVTYLAETKKTILEISTLCGFESVSSFYSAFKKHFNATPSEVRKNARNNRNNPVFISNMQEESANPSNYDKRETTDFLRRIWEMNIVIKELPDYKVAFVRHVGSYLDAFEAWRKLSSWAAKNNLLPPEQNFIGISLDDPHVTDEYACRYDACVTIPHDFHAENHPEMSFKHIQGGLYALYQFYDTVDKLAIAYQSIYGQWFPNSDFDPDDRHCLEFCMNNPYDDPEGKAKVDLYIPIKKRF